MSRLKAQETFDEELAHIEAQIDRHKNAIAALQERHAYIRHQMEETKLKQLRRFLSVRGLTVDELLDQLQSDDQ
ncbi:MAG TPA: hypothetical protein PLT28_00240 [Saprospiraceae bacterium]|nr:hypothetical protein [Saprospiraceae bacterium]